MNVSIIRLGTRLELELINSLGEKIGSTYVSQLIDSDQNENLEIACPIHESKIAFIPIGARVRIVLMHEKMGLLSFTGNITGKEKKENLVSLYVKSDNNFEKIQRRNYYRLDCLLTAKYRIIKDDEQDEEPDTEPKEKVFTKAIIKNLSGSGICIILNDEIAKNTLIEVQMQLTAELWIKVVGKVIRCDRLVVSHGKKFEAGVFFLEISKKDQDFIIRFVFEQQKSLLKNLKL